MHVSVLTQRHPSALIYIIIWKTFPFLDTRALHGGDAVYDF